MAQLNLDDHDVRRIAEQIISVLKPVIKSFTATRRVATDIKFASDPEPQSAADKSWGYVFGVDGLMSCEQATAFLGDLSRSSMERLVEGGKIRQGRPKPRGFLKFCRRSVREYAQSLEE
ncbi:MAG: DNA-binding protein [Schlesneria sp.]|nr:DNA-binding protein [Schlesneria sp.]